ncbi:MAG: 2Fe-2S ferredoxin-like protein [Comamonas sp.]|uniref:class I ribonucleotide reductase maintenance protein YfaE n=1 Tax=Comamonas sp. TaxID=34028 RepID=UPI0028234A93|nr:class I ribonucleotide reductase maintenance protein YfaE [Comamonas sp.]MDR0212824.1 2Fe-2S ferredoxin-like protein [Comamonas sp.]
MTTITTTSRVIHLLDGETLLEALERTGHEIEFQCRSGFCGMCRTTLRAGAVDYPSPPLAFIGPSEILPCCCRVTQPISIECSVPEQAQQLELDLPGKQLELL